MYQKNKSTTKTTFNYLSIKLKLYRFLRLFIIICAYVNYFLQKLHFNYFAKYDFKK